MRVLVAAMAWTAISFLFTWRWGTAISRAGDRPEERFELSRGQPATYSPP